MFSYPIKTNEYLKVGIIWIKICTLIICIIYYQFRGGGERVQEHVPIYFFHLLFMLIKLTNAIPLRVPRSPWPSPQGISTPIPGRRDTCSVFCNKKCNKIMVFIWGGTPWELGGRVCQGTKCLCTLRQPNIFG